jgi:hypothetical protein
MEMSQLSMMKGKQEYYSLYGVYPIEVEKQKLWNAFRGFIDTTFGNVSVPLLLGDRENAVRGTKKLRDDLKDVGV